MPDEPAPQHPDFNKPPAAAGEQRPPTPGLWLNPDQYAAWQEKVRRSDEIEAMHNRMLQEQETKRLQLMAEKGQIEQAFKEQRETWEKRQAEIQAKLAERERAWLHERRNQVINEAMAGRSFVGSDEESRMRTAGMVRRLLEMEIEAVIGPDGAPDVRHRSSLRPARDYLVEKFTSPESELSVLLAPNKPSGGAGTDGTRTASPPTPPAPNSLEAIAARYREQVANGFGLHPIQPTK